MDASVLAGLQSLNTSINNAAQIAAAVGDSKAAKAMHEADIAQQNTWRLEDKAWSEANNLQAFLWTKQLQELDANQQKEYIKMQQEYNSPVNQMKLLREAGLNPALAFGQNGSQIGLGSSGQHSAPSPPGVPSSGMPPQSGYFRAPQIGDPAQSFAAVAAAFQSIAQSKKTGVETGVLENTAADIARKITADANFAQIGASLAQEFGRPEREKSLRKIDEEIANLVASTANLAKTGAYTEALEAVAKVEKLIKENERLQGEEVLKVLPAQLRATINQIQSQTDLNRSQANVADEDSFRKGLENTILAAIQKYDPQRFEDAVMGQFEEAKKRGEYNQAQIDKINQVLPSLVQEMENAAKRGTPWTKEYFMDRIFGVAQSAISAGGHVLGAMILK